MNQKGRRKKELGKEENGNLCLHPIYGSSAMKKIFLYLWLPSEQDSEKIKQLHVFGLKYII